MKSGSGSRAEALAAWLLLAPALAAIFVFFVVPVGAGFVLSFTDFDIYAIADPAVARWVGGANYLSLLRDGVFWKSVGNS